MGPSNIKKLTDEQGPQERAVVTKLSQGVEEPVLGKREWREHENKYKDGDYGFYWNLGHMTWIFFKT